jgi:hypothetical protein
VSDTHTWSVTQSAAVTHESRHSPSIAHVSAPGQSLARVQLVSSGSWHTRKGLSLSTQRSPFVQSRESVQAL